MKVLSIEQGFGLENLRVAERPEPGPPGTGEVLVEVNAVSLNYRDLMVILGHYNPKQTLPLIPCSDASAVVQEVGQWCLVSSIDLGPQGRVFTEDLLCII